MMTVDRLSCPTALEFVNRCKISRENAMGFKKLYGQKGNIAYLVYFLRIKPQHIDVGPIDRIMLMLKPEYLQCQVLEVAFVYVKYIVPVAIHINCRSKTLNLNK